MSEIYAPKNCNFVRYITKTLKRRLDYISKNEEEKFLTCNILNINKRIGWDSLPFVLIRCTSINMANSMSLARSSARNIKFQFCQFRVSNGKSESKFHRQKQMHCLDLLTCVTLVDTIQNLSGRHFSNALCSFHTSITYIHD